MKKVPKAILIGLAGVVALVAVLLAGLSLYVQSSGMQARIQEELSKALRLPLKITKTDVGLWSGLRITGISIPNGDANFLEATGFTARYRLFPLLTGKLVIPEMRIENPKVIWIQNASGKWTLPQPAEAAEVARESTKQPRDTAPGNLPSENPPGEKAPKMPKAEKDKSGKKDFDLVISRLDVKDGTFALFDKERKPFATFSGVNMTCTKITADQLEGTITAARAVWTDGYILENVSTSFSYLTANEELWLPALNATLAGGTVRGSYRSHAEAKHTPFNAKLEFEKINIGPLVSQRTGDGGKTGGGDAAKASGQLRGKLEMHGETDRMEKAEGQGTLDLRDGRFSQFELFQTIGRILDIREFADFYISEGGADFRIAGDKIYVERLDLLAPSLAVTAKGTVRTDKEKKERKLSLDARLSVDEAIVVRLPGKVPEAFIADSRGRRGIEFKVSGTTDKPKTDLGEKLIAQTVTAQFGSLLGTFFDQKKEDEAQRKRDEDKRKKEEDDRKKAEKADKKDKKKKDKGTPAPDAAPAVEAAQTPSPAAAPAPNL